MDSELSVVFEEVFLDKLVVKEMKIGLRYDEIYENLINSVHQLNTVQQGVLKQVCKNIIQDEFESKTKLIAKFIIEFAAENPATANMENLFTDFCYSVENQLKGKKFHHNSRVLSHAKPLRKFKRQLKMLADEDFDKVELQKYAEKLLIDDSSDEMEIDRKRKNLQRFIENSTANPHINKRDRIQWSTFSEKSVDVCCFEELAYKGTKIFNKCGLPESQFPDEDPLIAFTFRINEEVVMKPTCIDAGWNELWRPNVNKKEDFGRTISHDLASPELPEVVHHSAKFIHLLMPPRKCS